MFKPPSKPSPASLMPNIELPSPDPLGYAKAMLGIGRRKSAAEDFAGLRSDSVRTAIHDAFWQFYDIDYNDYAAIYPYELVIDGAPINAYLSRFTLPIAPQNINMSAPVATAVAVTMKGLTEDHNGAPLRPISINATTGVLVRTPVQTAPKFSGLAGTLNREINFLARNTIQAGRRVADAASRLASSITGSAQQFTGPLNVPENEVQKNSGYYFFHKLQRFLDYYIALKSTREGRNARLIFAMHKDKMYWDVILNNYSFTKQAGTIEYHYTINMTAYRRRPKLEIGRPSKVAAVPTTAEQLSFLSRLQSSLKQGRVLLSKSLDVLTGLRADYHNNFVQPAKDILAFGNELLAIPQTFDMLTSSIIKSAKQDFIFVFRSEDIAGRLGLNKKIADAGLTTDPEGAAISRRSAIDIASRHEKSVSQAHPPHPVDIPDPLSQIFDNPEKYVEIFDNVVVDTLPLPDGVQEAVDRERERVQQLTVEDLQRHRDSMAVTASAIAEAMGGGSATYNRINGLPEPVPTLKRLTVTDIMLLDVMNDMVIAADHLIVMMKESSATADNDYFQFYSDYATANGIQIPPSNSKYYVPFPYGSSLESLAVQYLDDPDRWHEIAAINALKEPYIDEEGFDIELITGGGPGTVMVADAGKLYIGEVVELRSDTKPRQFKKISQITKMSALETVIEFEDKTMLSEYVVSDRARIHAFLPGTVNSTKLIAIPSESPVNVPGKIKLAPGIQDLNKIAQIAKQDILLQSDGDVVFSGNDIGIASGMTNLIQAATIRLQTRQGELLQDPGYGNPVQAGVSVADLNINSILESLDGQFGEDPRFSGTLAAQLRLKLPAVTIDLLLGVSNTGINLPLSANLPL